MSKATLGLDAFFTSVTAEQLHTLRALLPVDLLDQSVAAAAEAWELTRAATRATGSMTEASPTPARVPGWIRLGAVDALHQLLDGSARTCMHSPNRTRFEPVFAAA
ncbi:MAG: hypothetical protein ACXVXP_09790 [Mycobacteriaceae bacterium]